MAGPPLSCILLLSFIPESPRWLFSRGWECEGLAVLLDSMVTEMPNTPLVTAEFREIKGTIYFEQVRDLQSLVESLLGSKVQSLSRVHSGYSWHFWTDDWINCYHLLTKQCAQAGRYNFRKRAVCNQSRPELRRFCSSPYWNLFHWQNRSC